MIDGHDLIKAGYPQGPTFGEALRTVQKLKLTELELTHWVQLNKPEPKLTLRDEPYPWSTFMEADTVDEILNQDKVAETMHQIMRVPTTVSGRVMPDACPAGPVGTIPVGGVVTTDGTIHPGMHSADICCSLYLSVMSKADLGFTLDCLESVTHFGPGGRGKNNPFVLSKNLTDRILSNPFTEDLIDVARDHMGTQGDGNHFASIGYYSLRPERPVLVTHHGSRGFGAKLYKKGMDVAARMTGRVAEGIPKQNVWIPFDSQEGKDYWDALQIVREWTKENHENIHKAVALAASTTIEASMWNEHNFVFKDDNFFHHAKGATPTGKPAEDSNGLQIVPLNMLEPIMIIKGNDEGFAPHGAGRNTSRSQHKKKQGDLTDLEVFEEETKGIDARFYSGNIDTTELPTAYKDGPKVRKQMIDFGLAEVYAEVLPFGCIMAGDWEKDVPWRKKRRTK